MKTFFRLSLTAIAFLLFSGVFAATETKAQPLREALKRMDAHNKALSSLYANVAMDKYNSQLDERDVYEGKAIYLFDSEKKGRYVRIDWTKPVEESLAIINKDYVLYRPRLKQAITGNTDSAKNSSKGGGALAFINMSKAEIQANYSMRYIGEETISGGIATWHIELTPTKATSYKVADLWVDKDGMPRQMKITENNGDTTTVLLSNLVKNKDIPNAKEVFMINLPKDTKIVKG